MAISKTHEIEIFEREEFYSDFPNLDGRNHKVTSHPTPLARFPKRPYHVYNCLAMAVGDETKVWWPGGLGYWPRQPSEDTIAELVFVLSHEFKFRECESPDFEPAVRKLAIFADDNNIPLHVAFQPKYTGSPSRRWKSKMGNNVNIEHELWAVQSKLYGNPVKFMCKDLET